MSGPRPLPSPPVPSAPPAECSHPVPATRSLVPRRRLLLGGALLALAGCGQVELGGPAAYTPPPPGIDDIYRAELLALLDAARAVADGLEDPGGADAEATAAAVEGLAAALPVQRAALLTGAESETEDGERTGSAAGASPTEVPADVPGLLALLLELRELTTDAARQVSGSLARPVAAIGAHIQWSALRLAAASGEGEWSAPREAEDIEPAREVPETDPPSIGAESDYHLTLEQAQQEEWYAGYVHEVLAARSEDSVREDHEQAAALHRERAEQLAAIAEQDGGPVVTRAAVYALPTEPLDEATAAQLPTQVAQSLLTAQLALAGAAPFGRRPLPIAASLQEAGTLAGLVGELDPLPSLAVDEELAASDRGA